MKGLFSRPSRLMMGAAAVAAVANAFAFAASTDIASNVAGNLPTSRLGVSLQDAVTSRTSAAAAEKRKLEMREQAVKASEARLAGQMRQQREQQAAAAKSGAQGGAQSGALAGGPPVPTAPYDNLARIYQTMKPNRAGPIFEKLDIEVQKEVATRMRERSTAQIMANMSPQGAVALSMALAGRRVVPAPVAAGTKSAAR